MKLDATDVRILGILQDDGRITNTALARAVDISASPTLERVRKLEKSGVIRKYVALVEPSEVGVGIHTFVEVTLTVHGRGTVDEFIAAVDEMDEVMECHHVTGDADFLLKIATRDIAAYEHLVLNRLTRLPNVQNLKTMVVLSTVKDETAYNLEGANHVQQDRP